MLDSQPLLTASQRRIVGFALTLLAFLGSCALLVTAFYVFGRLLGFFSGVLWPLTVAGILALLLRPLVEILERRLKIRRLVAVILLYGVFLLVAAGVLVTVVPPVADQFIAFIAFLPRLWESASNYFQEHYPQWVELAQRQLANPTVRNLVDGVVNQLKAVFSHAFPSVGAAFGGLFDVIGFIAHLAIIPVYLFFFLLLRGVSIRNLGNHLPFLSPPVRSDVVFLVTEFVSIIESYFRGQLLISLCIGGLLATGYSIIGLKFGLFIGLTLGLLNVVPYLGSIMGLLTVFPLALFQPGGGWQLVGLVLLVNAIVQCTESWVLTPKIMGHQTGLHPAMIIVAIFFWGTAFGGILGMLLAVPLTAFFVTAWRLAKQKYFRAENA